MGGSDSKMYQINVNMTRRRTFGVVATVALAAVAAYVARSATVDTTVTSEGKIAFSERIIEPKDDVYRIVVMNANGGERRALPANRFRHSDSPAWSPDATEIAFVGFLWGGEAPDDIWVMNADGRAQHRLTRNGDEPAWSPDGRSIAFSRAGDIYVMKTDGSEQRRLTRNGTTPAWSPDGRRIAFVRAVAPRCGGNRDVRRCENGREIYVMRADGTGQQRLTRNRFSEYSPDWSPTGTKIAYARQLDPDGDSHVFVMGADGSNQRRLPDELGAEGPSWSPDGTKIVYIGGYGIFTMNADGSGKRQLYPTCPECGSPTWSRQ